MLACRPVDGRLLIAALGLVACLAAGADGAGEKRRPATPPAEAAADSSALQDGAAPPADAFSGDAAVTVRRKTVAYDLVKFGRSVHVHADEVVRGDVVLLGGDLRVDGEIVGGAVVLSGNIQAGPEASIGGQAVAVGGRVEAAAGADVRGGTVSLSFLPTPLFRGLGGDRAEKLGALTADLVKLALLLLAAWLAAATASRRLAAAGSHLDHTFLRCFGLGMLGLTGGLFAVTVIVVLLAITLLGIPLALALAFAAGVLLVAAFVVGTMRIGTQAAAALQRTPAGSWRYAALGSVLVFAPQFVADLLRGTLGLRPLGVALQLVHAALVLVALAAGLGALVLSRLGRRLASPADPAGGVVDAAVGGAAEYQPFHETEAPAP